MTTIGRSLIEAGESVGQWVAAAAGIGLVIGLIAGAATLAIPVAAGGSLASAIAIAYFGGGIFWPTLALVGGGALVGGALGGLGAEGASLLLGWAGGALEWGAGLLEDAGDILRQGVDSLMGSAYGEVPPSKFRSG